MSSWTEQDDQLEKTFTFSNFTEAMAWMLKASYMMEKMDHHAEWTNIYNKVQVKLRTHSAGNKVTEKDRQLAAGLDKI